MRRGEASALNIGIGRAARTSRATARAARRAPIWCETRPRRHSGSSGARKRTGPCGEMTTAITSVRKRAAAGVAARWTIGREEAVTVRIIAAAERRPAAAAAHAVRKVAAAAPLVALAKVRPALKRDCAAFSPARRTAGFCGCLSDGGGSRRGEGTRGPGICDGEKLRGGAGDLPRAAFSARDEIGVVEREGAFASRSSCTGRQPSSCFTGGSEPTSMPGTTSADQKADGPWRRSRRRGPCAPRSWRARGLACPRSRTGSRAPAAWTCSRG